MAMLLKVAPISDEDPMALPVTDINTAISFYCDNFGFQVQSSNSLFATFMRDEIEIGVVVDPRHEPGKAGSLAIETDDLDSLHSELEARGVNPGQFGVDEWDNMKHRTFFVVERGNGYCYCFYSTLDV